MIPVAERPVPTDAPAGSAAGRAAVAVAAAWVVPGLGHILLGRVRRGILFGAIVWASFGLGLAHDGRLALRDPRQPVLSTLQIVANLGAGPADVLARVAVYGRPVYAFRGVPGPRSSGPIEETFRNRTRSGVSIYGTAYLWTAGLLNLLLLFDVWDIAAGRRL
jgi:hypothetical protein